MGLYTLWTAQIPSLGGPSERFIGRAGVIFVPIQITPKDLEAWRLWMKEVFMPVNIRMETIVIENAHLIIDGKMPECFLDLAAHLAVYKAVIKKWESGDFTQHLSSINHPSSSLTHYITASYA